MKNVGWSGTWQDFFEINKTTFLNELKAFYHSLPWTDTLSPAQEKAWQIEYDVMQASLAEVCTQYPLAKTQCWLAFEQELVGEGGKRAADVNLVLPSGELFVVEFKHKEAASHQEITRANFDLQTMLHFHSESTKLKGRGFLALTKENAEPFQHSDISCDIVKENRLPQLIQALNKSLNQPYCYDVTNWQSGSFYRQPSILHGTVKVFFEQEIPTLKTEAGNNILAARQALVELYRQAKTQQQRYVVVVNGRPGAGKTLLGISVVADLVNQFGAEQCKPLFLSGNGPLVQVLRYTLDFYQQQKKTNSLLQSKVLIENLISFKQSLKSGRANERDEHFVVFDEAQRAWEKVNSREENSPSELEIMCDWLAEKPFGVLVLLVGDGQAIHNNEMSSVQLFQQLDRVLQHRHHINLILPSESSQYIQHTQFTLSETFNLKTPIRQYYTEQLDHWIEAVLAGKHIDAQAISQNIKAVYPLCLTNNRQAAEDYAKALQMEVHDQNKKYSAFRAGWLMSSKGGKFLPETKREQKAMGAWYVEPPQSPASCCQFKTACTEFACQGLELSLALLCWGKDLQFRGEHWQLNTAYQHRRKQDYYTFGSYRVLLSRGRTGLIIFCEDEGTYTFLQRCGMDILE